MAAASVRTSRAFIVYQSLLSAKTTDFRQGRRFGMFSCWEWGPHSEDRWLHVHVNIWTGRAHNKVIYIFISYSSNSFQKEHLKILTLLYKNSHYVFRCPHNIWGSSCWLIIQKGIKFFDHLLPPTIPRLNWPELILRTQYGLINLALLRYIFFIFTGVGRLVWVERNRTQYYWLSLYRRYCPSLERHGLNWSSVLMVSYIIPNIKYCTLP